MQHNKYGCTVVHMLEQSSSSHLEDALDILRATGADLEAKDYSGDTVLTWLMRPHTSLTSGYAETINIFVSRGANINAQDYHGNGLLHYVVDRFSIDLEKMEILLSLGADPLLPNHNGDTLLHRLAAHVALQSDEKCVLGILKLLEKGVSPVVRNYKGQTPLHILCNQVAQIYFEPTAVPSVPAIDVLLNAGLGQGLNTPDYSGILPIHLAATISEVLVGKLISRGADATSATKEGRNLLHIASIARQSNIVGFLLRHYERSNKMSLVNAKCIKGRTPLHEACRSGRIETVSLLLDVGADVHARALEPRAMDRKSIRPLDACLEFGEEEKFWEYTEERLSPLGSFVASGVLSSDETRPREPKIGQLKKKPVGTCEIKSENDTVAIRSIMRLLVARGAALESAKVWSNSLLDDAIHVGQEEAVIELEQLAREHEVQFRRPIGLELDYMTLRSQKLPALLDTQLRGYFSHYDMMHLVLHGHSDELVQALERNLVEGQFGSDHLYQALSETLVTVARYGYHDLFARLGRLMPTDDWINQPAKGALRERVIPYLLAASLRKLPNINVINVIVKQFHADVNLVFTEGLKSVPDFPFYTEVDVKRMYKPGDKILHYLAQGRHWWPRSAVDYLLQHGADPNARDREGKTPLCRALGLGHTGGYGQREIVGILLKGGADPNLTASCGWTPLGMAAHDTSLARTLLEYGARPSSHHPMEIFNALGSFNVDLVNTFLGLDLGIDINKTVLSDAQDHWHTWRVQKVFNEPEFILHPLHYISLACFDEPHARTHAIKMTTHLLRIGADPYLLVDDQQTILHRIFAENGIIQPYLEMKHLHLDLERRNASGRTLLLAAASSPCGTNSYAFNVSLFPLMDQRFHPSSWVEGDLTRAMTLFLRGADITAVDNDGDNVLHYLVRHKCAGNTDVEGVNHQVVAHHETVAIFLKRVPALASQRNSEGCTPWDAASRLRNTWALDVLPKPDEVNPKT